MTQKIEDQYPIVAPEQVIEVPRERPPILTRALDGHLGLLFRFLGPEKRYTAAYLHVREGARVVVKAYDHLSLDKVRYVA